MPEPSEATPKKAVSNLAARLGTAAVLVPILLWLMFVGPWWGFLGLVLVGLGLATFELGAMVSLGPLQRALLLVMTSAVLVSVSFAPSPLYIAATLAALPIVAAIGALATPDPIETAALRFGWSLGGPIYVGGSLATLELLHQRPHGGAWVLLSMMLGWFADTGGYFAGRAFGRRKLYEKISPKKTVEGAIGAVVAAMAGASFVTYMFLPPVPVWHAALLAIVGSVVGQGGDLVESLVKRSTGVKDSGAILPGHGGMLDRIDALLFASVVTWVYATFVLPAAG